MGTGFLVGPDLVLTNQHVIQPLADGTVALSLGRLRFDYKMAEDGTVVTAGTTFALAADWLIASRPPSTADEETDPAGRLPAPDELDFALLRLRDSPGDQPAGRAGELPDAPARGWIRAGEVGSDGFDARHTLFILQHPAGQPLKVAVGPSQGLNANHTRLRYQVNTEKGSSGAPCLNSRFELVALHHAGDPNWTPTYNAGIPIAAIRSYLAGNVPAAGAFRD